MDIWRDTNSPAKSTTVLLTISLTIIILPICNSQIITNMEGEWVEFDFPYPCNISRVTLRYGNRSPSYNSANPSSVSMSSNQNLTNKNESENNECSLHLTINHVSRNDEGTYILTGYDGNGDYIYDTRIGLRVNYPPGKASCESSDQYIEGWIRLQCSARVGNLPGQIICYQNGMRVPPLTPPAENNGILSQYILARSEGLVYCCSSTLQETTDMCKCKGIAWDPVLNIAVTNFTDPCPVVLSSTQVLTISQSPIEITESEATKISILATTKASNQTINGNENKNPGKNPFALLESVGITSLFFTLTGLFLDMFIAVLFVRVLQGVDLVKRLVEPKVHESVELGQNGAP